MQEKLYKCLFVLFCLTMSCRDEQTGYQDYYRYEPTLEDEPPATCSQITNLDDQVHLPNYVILTREMFVESLGIFVDDHANEYAIKLLVVDSFVQGDTDYDVTEQIRAKLAEEYIADSVNYLLIVGAPDPEKRNQDCNKLNLDWEIPMRYVPHLGEDTKPAMDNDLIPTDQYYASVNEQWDGENFSWMKRFAFKADYLVGRVPVKSTEDLRNWIQKNRTYRTPKIPHHSIFTNDACTQPGAHFPQDYMNKFLSQHTHSITSHKCDQDAGGNISDFSNADQADFISVYSHGNSQAIVAGQKGYSLLADEFLFAKPPIIFAHACDTATPDLEKNSLGMDLIAMPNGALAYVGYTRSNTSIIHPFWERVFLDDELTLGKAVYLSKQRLFKHKLPTPDKLNDWFALVLFGDPTLNLALPNQSIRVNTQAISGDEPITVCADIATDHASTDTKIAQTVYSNSIDVVLDDNRATIPIELLPIDDAHQLPKFNYLALSDCDVSIESCTGSTVRMTAVLDYSCNWLERQDGDTKAFQVMTGNDYSMPVTFVLKAARGTFYKNGCNEQDCDWDYRVIKQWKEDSVDKGWSTVAFDAELPNDPLPKIEDATENSVYLSGSLLLEAYDTSETLIGSCYLNQTDYAPTFD